MASMEEIKSANPEFFRLSEKFGDEGYTFRKRGSKQLLQVKTRFGAPVYRIDPKTNVLTFSHEDQPRRRFL